MKTNTEIQKELIAIQFAGLSSLKLQFLAKMRKPFQVKDYKQKLRERIEIQLIEGFKINEQLNQQRFKCRLCKDYFVKFTVTSCGHCFCYICIFEHLLKTHVMPINIQKCPQCQSVLKGLQFIYCKSIDKILKEEILNLGQQPTEIFINRKKLLKEWKLKKKVQNLQIGDSIDVLDTEHIWCVGKIINIREKKENQLLIHYQGWNKAYDEYISIASPRLSSLGLFTNRTDILLYQPSANEETMSNFVRQVGQQQTELSNYVIFQHQSPHINYILAFEQSHHTSLSDLLSLVLFLRQLNSEQQESDDEEMQNQ